jgi:hypothetical protein
MEQSHGGRTVYPQMAQMDADHQDPHASTRIAGEFLSSDVWICGHLRHLRTNRPVVRRPGRIPAADWAGPGPEPTRPATKPAAGPGDSRRLAGRKPAKQGASPFLDPI